ncbi:MAG: PAS domain-containing protein [Elusimicrobiales bacterium]|jgi:nitrogen fixation/metabolism regulation signal transduction histidine kinase
MLKNAVEYYQCILDNLTGGLISVDISGTVVYINPMAGKILHWEDMHGCLEADYNKAFDNFPALHQVIKEALETHKTVRRAEISIMHANVPLIIGYSTMCVKGRDGRDLGVTVIFQDISFVGGGKK